MIQNENRMQIEDWDIVLKENPEEKQKEKQKDVSIIALILLTAAASALLFLIPDMKLVAQLVAILVLVINAGFINLVLTRMMNRRVLAKLKDTLQKNRVIQFSVVENLPNNKRCSLVAYELLRQW